MYISILLFKIREKNDLKSLKATFLRWTGRGQEVRRDQQAARSHGGGAKVIVLYVQRVFAHSI